MIQRLLLAAAVLTSLVSAAAAAEMPDSLVGDWCKADLGLVTCGTDQQPTFSADRDSFTGSCVPLRVRKLPDPHARTDAWLITANCEHRSVQFRFELFKGYLLTVDRVR
jgi:hypothetical protein